MPHAKIRTLMQLNTDQRLSKLSRKSLSRSRFHLVARTLLRVNFPHLLMTAFPSFYHFFFFPSFHSRSDKMLCMSAAMRQSYTPTFYIYLYSLFSTLFSF